MGPGCSAKRSSPKAGTPLALILFQAQPTLGGALPAEGQGREVQLLEAKNFVPFLSMEFGFQGNLGPIQSSPVEQLCSV